MCIEMPSDILHTYGNTFADSGTFVIQVQSAKAGDWYWSDYNLHSQYLSWRNAAWEKYEGEKIFVGFRTWNGIFPHTYDFVLNCKWRIPEFLGEFPFDNGFVRWQWYAWRNAQLEKSL